MQQRTSIYESRAWLQSTQLTLTVGDLGVVIVKIMASHVTRQPTAALERELVNTVCKLIPQLVTRHGPVAIELSKATVKKQMLKKLAKRHVHGTL